jgi:hypothetical protein
MPWVPTVVVFKHAHVSEPFNDVLSHSLLHWHAPKECVILRCTVLNGPLVSPTQGKLTCLGVLGSYLHTKLVFR